MSVLSLIGFMMLLPFVLVVFALPMFLIFHDLQEDFSLSAWSAGLITLGVCLIPVYLIVASFLIAA